MLNVYVSGVFDLFHEGHVNFLEKASSFGRLIVGVHDDEFVTAYKRQPVVPQASRYAVVRSCRYVDEVIEGAGLLTAGMLEDLRIGLVLHGDDFSSEQVNKYFHVAVEKGIFKLISYTKGVSSTEILSAVLNRMAQAQRG